MYLVATLGDSSVSLPYISSVGPTSANSFGTLFILSPYKAILLTLFALLYDGLAPVVLVSPTSPVNVILPDAVSYTHLTLPTILRV